MSIEIPVVSNRGRGPSTFSKRSIELAGPLARQLSEQIKAENFRLRKSSADYSSDWHVAGDPTLLIILSGTIKVELRNGDWREFSAGEMFIAEDYLESGVRFDNEQHGHRAKVVGEVPLSALHLKLSKR